ncbi:hypothetical protein [Streptomyces scabiei]|uniref:hypothetical protein n=1 Tax=Streptomyces scabiei TaxID=1930 RepID=UPI00073F44FD|nr:hypothetical protein [Streptomyces scabiei]
MDCLPPDLGEFEVEQALQISEIPGDDTEIAGLTLGLEAAKDEVLRDRTPRRRLRCSPCARW